MKHAEIVDRYREAVAYTERVSGGWFPARHDVIAEAQANEAWWYDTVVASYEAEHSDAA